MPALARAAIGDSLLNVVTGIGTTNDPRTSPRYHLRLLEKNVLEHVYRGDVGGELTLYRSPRFSRRSRALLSAFKRGLRRMLASDLVRALDSWRKIAAGAHPSHFQPGGGILGWWEEAKRRAARQPTPI